MSESAMLLLRMLGSLLLVGLLLWALARVARTRGLSSLDRGLIDVRAQRGLTRNSSLVLVRVGARHLLIGVAEGGVRLHSEGDDLVVEQAPVAESDAADVGDLNGATGVGISDPTGLMNRIRERTVRKRR